VAERNGALTESGSRKISTDAEGNQVHAWGEPSRIKTERIFSPAAVEEQPVRWLLIHGNFQRKTGECFRLYERPHC